MVIKEYRIGIIGFGFMGKTHTYGYKTIPLYYSNLPFKIKLAGVCSRTLEAAQRAKEIHDFEFATDRLSDIVENDGIDIVNICTPNVHHKEAIIRALKAGKHVYCDKPLTVSGKEAQEVLEVLGRSRSVHQVAFNYRFFPATLRAKELIEEGRIGRILSFRTSYLHSGSVDANKPIGWKQDIRYGGGGVLFDLGSHVLDLMYHLMGEYQSLCAVTDIAYGHRPDKNGNMIPIEAEDAVYVLLRMKNGAMGTMEASKIATGTNDELRFEIHGDRGAIRFNLMEPNWLDFFDNMVPERPLGGIRGFTRIECVQRYEKPGGEFPSAKASIGWIRAHVHCLYSFLTCVHEHKPTSPSFHDGAYIQHVMERAYLSNQTRAWVDV